VSSTNVNEPEFGFLSGSVINSGEGSVINSGEG
jgi:hypothetical protein